MWNWGPPSESISLPLDGVLSRSMDSPMDVVGMWMCAIASDGNTCWLMNNAGRLLNDSVAGSDARMSLAIHRP
jgi:hypothetical protein